MRLRTTVLGLLLLFTAQAAQAHKPSDSYLTITSGESQLQAQWDISLKDLETLVGLDTNHNGEITWGELKAQRDAVAAHALAHLAIKANGKTCPGALQKLRVDHHSDGAYAVLDITFACPGDTTQFELDYSLLFERDPTHRGLVQFRNAKAGNAESSAFFVIKPGQPPIIIGEADDTRSAWQTLQVFVVEGVWHIWQGFDHLLFLLTLLLPAVLVRVNRGWQPVASFRPAFFDIFKIVTAFTVAHSITLWLAVLGYVSLPSRLVESLIALSIVITALNNLKPLLPLSLWVVAFGFGLIHGFGFASVLGDLGLAPGALAVSLFGFNLGVELGQLALVVLLFPLAYLLRTTVFYRWVVLGGGSLLAALLAGIWLYERVFNQIIIGI